MNRKQRSNNAQQPQPWQTTIGNDEAAEKRYRRKEQGEDYNQPRQEHANNGMILSLERNRGSYYTIILFVRGLIGLLTGGYMLTEGFGIRFEGLLALIFV